MSSPTTRNSYLDCYDLWDRAIDAPHGIRFRVQNHDAAYNLRVRLHMSRTIDREGNAKTYPPGNPMHGQSVYDPLQVLIREDADEVWWVYLEPRAIPIIGDIEQLQPYEASQWPELSSQPKLGSPTGIKLLEKKSEPDSNVPSESSSSTPSTPQGRAPTIPSLRRL